MNDDFNKTFKFITPAAAVMSFCVSLTLFCIWMFVPVLKEFSSATMKVNAALALFFASAAALIINSKSTNQQAAKSSPAIGLLSFSVFAIGFSTLCEYIFDLQLGIDELLAVDLPKSAELLFPGRMSPNASFGLCLLGLGLLTTQFQNSRRIHWPSVFLVPLILLSGVSLIGYAYGEQSFYRIGPFIRISWVTASLFLSLAIGILWSQRERGALRIFASRGSGGVLARRLIPVVVVLPFFLGGLWLVARKNEIVSREFGVALFVLIIIFVFVLFVSYIANALDSFDAKSALLESDRIRDLQNLNYQRSLTQIIAENASSCLFMMDDKGIATYMNKVAENVTGFKLKELRERPLHDYIHHHRPDGTHYPLEERPLGKAYTNHLAVRNSEETFIRKDGRFFPVNYSIVPVISSGVLTGSVLEFRDISDQKRIENELLQSKEVAEKANRTKSLFLANMSHEIRSPMNSILGFADLLQQKSLSEDERDHYVSRIRTNGKHLINIIDDILDLSRVEAGQLNVYKEKFSIQCLISDCVESISLQASSKSLYLKTEFPAQSLDQIENDPARLKQVLLNLLSNAVKFTQQGSIVIRVNFLENFASKSFKLQVDVEDTGIGIATENRDRLFRPFSQVDDSVTRQYGGTGLGLNLSRQLVRLMGGDLELAWSEVGKGSCFRLTIDAGKRTLVEDTSSLRAPIKMHASVLKPDFKFAKQAHILVVDDSPENQTLMKLYLTKLGLSSDSAHNGVEAIEKAMSQAFDLVLMDVQMPVLDGLEATRQLRNQGYQVPIVALTAHAMKEDIEKSLLAGCNCHLSKPIDRKELVRVLQVYLIGDPFESKPESDDL